MPDETGKAGRGAHLFSPYQVPDIARWWGLRSEHTSFPVLVGLAWWEIEINRSAYNVLKKNKAG